ncbi:hypothetical protein T08_13761 [Trichinella sp. T8]|nr:hypothetical protein T08_13761 [Trichinella sp. T8]
MKWERRVDDQRQGFDFCFDQRPYQKIPQAECRQKSYRNCGCNLASITSTIPQRAAEGKSDSYKGFSRNGN